VKRCAGLASARSARKLPTASPRDAAAVIKRGFVVLRARTRLADSSFTIAGSAAWNSLHVYIRTINSHDSFCRQLKTYLFSLSG